MALTQEELQALKAKPSNVPCAGCTACCKRDRIVLLPGEESRFEWHLEGGRRVLNRKANGECINLTPAGCAVHANPPDVCKRFDCRVLFLTTPKSLRRANTERNPTMKEVYEAGKKRAKTLIPITVIS